eukprot:COSAG04_NODE_17310_length_472_cov_5.504021_1_plen_62_part_01
MGKKKGKKRLVVEPFVDAQSEAEAAQQQRLDQLGGAEGGGEPEPEPEAQVGAAEAAERELPP